MTPRPPVSALPSGDHIASEGRDRTLTIGSLFTGAGMLDRAVEEVFDARTAWVSDIDPGACKILAHRLTGRPAPEPTEPGPKGGPRLSAKFVEWMMMQPAGWITDTPGITRNEALKLCGNGVVTPQAVHALRVMLDRIGAA